MKQLLFLLITLFSMLSCKKTTTDELTQSTSKDLSGKVDFPASQLSNIAISSEVDNASPLNDGTFSINTHTTLIALNTTNNQVIYFGLPGSDEKNNYSLDAKETALYFSLGALTNIRRPYYKPFLTKIKTALYTIPEVKALEQSIKNCITQKGYLDENFIGNDIGKAVDRILTDFGAEQRAYTTDKVIFNPTYGATGGYYRVSDVIPDGWQDMADPDGTYKLKRQMFNSTAAVVGVQIGNYNAATGNSTLSNNYIGFLDPYYPPNLTSVEGTIDNLKQLYQATLDIMSNGINGLSNTDAYSTGAEFTFQANEKEKNAVLFVNGAVDPKILGLNIAYLFIDNFQDIYEGASEKNIFSKDDFLNGFLGDLITDAGSATRLANYYTWFKNQNYDFIISDLQEQLVDYIKKLANNTGDAVVKETMNFLKDQVTKKFIASASWWSEIYKYSRVAYKFLSYNVISSSTKFYGVLPLEFDNIKLPPVPYQPIPFNVSLNNVSSINFQWNVDNSTNQILTYNLYLSSNIGGLGNKKIASNISSTNFSYNNNIAKNARLYWQVEVVNSSGLKRLGPIWMFDNGIPKTLPSCIDGEGYNYDRLQISNLLWTSENLRARKDTSGNGLTTSGNGVPYDVYIYNNDNTNYINYGCLYNGRYMKQSIIPTGWRLPSKADFENLLNNAGVDTFGFVTSPSGLNVKFGGTGHHHYNCNSQINQVSFSGLQNTAVFVSSTLGPNSVGDVSYKRWALVVDNIQHTARLMEIEYSTWVGQGACDYGYNLHSVRLVKDN